MASKAIIPRFLLPLQGPLWRGIRIPLSQNIHIRFASTDKPLPLEKPARFNPPSHGSRLKKSGSGSGSGGSFIPPPKHYGRPLTAEEVAAQKKTHYPGLMAPEGTWSHWFWHNRLLHTFITMGTLFAMGLYTFFLNYAYNSPFKDLVPPISDLWNNPAYFFSAWKNVIIMHEKDKAIKATEHRNQHLDDVAKRRYFMKMHGIEPKDPVAMIFGRDDGKSVEELEAAALGHGEAPHEAGQKTATKKKN
ncbi:hypothetical protein ESCO_002134 [Escovopsis weberi]|uniref:Uncharacterized protein n=1 Tax=Escovopsis weberi TaxID=150374 RepID=A0A0M8N815_ESCWE|nr:hypothetical protein ESCO_002134 [Escovopsis weberi]